MILSTMEFFSLCILTNLNYNSNNNIIDVILIYSYYFMINFCLLIIIILYNNISTRDMYNSNASQLATPLARQNMSPLAAFNILVLYFVND